MKEAIWEFLWCVDKTTTEENGKGWVWGKTPVTIDQIAKDLGESIRSVQYHLQVLKKHNYITLTCNKKGLIISVFKSKKWLARKDVTSEERELLKALKSVPNYPFEYETDLRFLRTLRVEFPGIKILEELAKWRVWLWDNPTKLRGDVNYRLRFRNWVEKAVKWQGKGGGSVDGPAFVQLTKSRGRLEKDCGRRQILEELEKLSPLLHDSLRKFLDKTYPTEHSYHLAKGDYDKKHVAGS